jgi:predicted phage tail protein
MTKIKLHGILAKEYGEIFNMKISKPRDVIKAIDCNRSGFRKRVVDLQKQGFVYDILVDKKRMTKESFLNSKSPHQIDLVPVIVGSGLPLLEVILIAVAQVAISYALMDPGTLDGGEATVGSTKGSLLFQGGNANVASQGSPIPIGYGRLKVGSQIVQSSVKSFPQSIESSKVMTSNQLTIIDSPEAEIKSNKVEPA